jgi:hypothetical protein
MGGNLKTIVVGVVALIIGGGGAGYYGMMQVDDVTQKLTAALKDKDQAVQSADRLRKTNDDAAKKYGKDIGAQVAVAGAADDPAKLIDNARAILATRDAFRASLDGARATLDSDLDALALELGNATPNSERIRQMLDSLKQGWPDREKKMEDATRKLLADLGIGQAAAAPKAAPAPAAPAAAPAPAATQPAKK